jgi:3'-phosphoadenosine 5'-phosphosulfate sulfotransferase (PAPS reductase)/FAD synthetase
MGHTVTQKELNEKLNWSLNQKIDHSLYIIDSFISQFPNCVVSFSGGIDSQVLLHLTRVIDKNRKGVFANTTNEHSEILKHVKTVENIETILPEITFIQIVEKYGFPLISKQIARMLNDLKHPTEKNKISRNNWIQGLQKDGTKSKYILPKKYKHIINAPFDVTNKCCYYLKRKPLLKINKNGSLIGTKVLDSILRRFIYLQNGCIQVKRKQSTPLSIWTKEDIWKFIQQNKISYCDIYNQGEDSTGCAYCGFGCQFDTSRFARLKEREPKRYNQMMNLKNNGVIYAEGIKTALNIPIENYQSKLFLNLH